jgi:hypothetical protein
MRQRIHRLTLVALLTALGLAVGSSVAATPLPPLYRVNAPHFSPSLVFDQTAVFWFGRVTPTENYADVRVAYIDRALWVHVNIMDQHLWYDESPSAATLTDWDSVTLYLDKRGNTGGAPTQESYRFDGQLNWWEPRANWQTAYRGNGATWVSTPISFTTYNNWNGDGPPNTADYHQGWFIAFVIPFDSLGLPSPPPSGTTWGLSIALHDRDTAAGPMNPDKYWPPNLSTGQPSTWGQLRFGLPGYTLSTPIVPQGTTVVRQGLNGSVVQDAVVGGNTLCGGTLSDYFVQWGNLNYTHVPVFNVQNVEQISEWPCFSKAFITFPLNSVPVGKGIISATVTLYHSGNPGPAPEPAYIQMLTVSDDWNEDSITWNNTPLARENLGGVWIPSVQTTPPYPGIPYTWDVSRAVAEAYNANQPLRLALYSAHGPFHGGRYFYSSDVEDYNAVGRPTLAITWGSIRPTLRASVQPAVASTGGIVTYTISLQGTGNAMTLTNDLPALVSPPLSVNTSGGGTATYNMQHHRIDWAATVASGVPVTITFPVTVLATDPAVLISTVVLTDSVTGVATSTALVIANGRRVYLPLMLK